MLIARIDGATRELGKPKNWPEGQECLTLPIKDIELEDGSDVMASAWQPDSQELERLVQGGHVILWVWGTGHPPVAMTVRTRSVNRWANQWPTTKTSSSKKPRSWTILVG